VARLPHTQQAGYLDSMNERSDWNPSDYAHHLSRRPRGLPFWFSLAAHGTRSYTEAVEKTLTVARAGAALIESTPHLELVMEPTLSILAFRRTGWTAEEYAAWSDSLFEEGSALVVPTKVDGAPALRFCIVNPRTEIDDIAAIVETLA
jgi:glutamate/tyrosine decarboxylase-like PLP-dependent enzyme